MSQHFSNWSNVARHHTWYWFAKNWVTRKLAISLRTLSLSHNFLSGHKLKMVRKCLMSAHYFMPWLWSREVPRGKWRLPSHSSKNNRCFFPYLLKNNAWQESHNFLWFKVSQLVVKEQLSDKNLRTVHLPSHLALQLDGLVEVHVAQALQDLSWFINRRYIKIPDCTMT